MVNTKRVQSRNIVRWMLFLCVPTFFIISVFIPLTMFTKIAGSSPSLERETITVSALGPVFFWCVAWPIALAPRPFASAFRTYWMVGCVLLWIHTAVAFHLTHGWSHEAAWKHTQEVGGYGDGIYVNYAFAIVWLIDVIWSRVAFDSYLARPRWLRWSIQGFLAFVVFNAAVVFGSGFARVTFAIGFLFSLVLVRLFRSTTRTVESSPQ